VQTNLQARYRSLHWTLTVYSEFHHYSSDTAAGTFCATGARLTLEFG